MDELELEALRYDHGALHSFYIERIGMNNFETVVKDVDDFVGDFISKLTTKQLTLMCVWVFVLIYMWARAFGLGLFFMDVIVFLWVAKNTYLFTKSIQELWRRVWRRVKS